MATRYQQYREWLIENNETQDRVPFREWLAGTVQDTATENQLIVSEVVGGNLQRARAGSVLDEVKESADDDLNLGMLAMARTRMSRISNMMEFVDQVEDRLRQRVQIDVASIDQLLAVHRQLRSSVRDDVHLVTEVINSRKAVPDVGKMFNLSFTENVLNVGNAATKMVMSSRDSRDRTRLLIDSMVNVVKKNDDAA